MAHAPAFSRNVRFIRDARRVVRSRAGLGSEVGEQVRRFAVVEELGVGKLGEGGWDRDDGSAGTGVRPGHGAVVTA